MFTINNWQNVLWMVILTIFTFQPSVLHHYEVPQSILLIYRKYPQREKCPYSEIFWSVFSRIRTEYGPEKL